MGEHRFRNLPAILPGKGEVFMADPRLLVVDPDFNCRDMKSAETLAHIDWLADEIEAQGFNPEMPLTVKRRGDDAVILRGHCRHAACMKLIEKGVELPKIPVMQIASGMSDVDLIFDQESSNFGLRLDELAKGRLCLKARRLGIGDDEIARRMHWKSVGSVAQHIKMVEIIPEPVKQQIRDGDISATEATRVVTTLPKGTDPVEAAKIIAENKEENKRIVGDKKNRSTKVTRKTLERGKAKAEPKKEPMTAQELREYHRAPEGATPVADLPSELPATSEIPPATAPNAEVEIPPAQPPVHEQLRVAAEREYPAPSRSHDINQKFFAIIARLATIGEESELNERADDEMISVPAEVIKAADRAYREHVGDTTAEAA